ncbi:MAG: type II toxin-antitoxin system Phd/YefM family antitoxin [Planctomycetes bacterium]|nr:type II toxin-antitoxin system Phd/YefM family antitoxin [Planctomycetota bacterium]
MNEVNTVDGIVTLSEFRANMAKLIERARLNREPLVLTQHGKSVAVVLSPAEYEALTERERFVEAVNEGLVSLDRGEGIPNEEVEQRIRKRVAELRRTAKKGDVA